MRWLEIAKTKNLHGSAMTAQNSSGFHLLDPLNCHLASSGSSTDDWARCANLYLEPLPPACNAATPTIAIDIIDYVTNG